MLERVVTYPPVFFWSDSASCSPRFSHLMRQIRPVLSTNSRFSFDAEFPFATAPPQEMNQPAFDSWGILRRKLLSRGGYPFFCLDRARHPSECSNVSPLSVLLLLYHQNGTSMQYFPDEFYDRPIASSFGSGSPFGSKGAQFRIAYLLDTETPTPSSLVRRRHFLLKKGYPFQEDPSLSFKGLVQRMTERLLTL